MDNKVENTVENSVENKLDKADKKVPATNKKVVARGMKAKLDKLPKVTVKIPIDKQNPKDLIVTVQINGYPYFIERGQEVQVPNIVKKILENADII